MSIGPGPGPDGMGMDTHRERQEMKRSRQAGPNWAVVDWRSFDVIKDGFDSQKEANDWLQQIPDGERAPEWKKSDDVEPKVVDIG